MSHTVKGSKAPGFDYWTARPLNKGGGFLGRFTKALSHRIERRAARKEIDSILLEEKKIC